ncbi:hypothetical protein [Paenacidovorax caeni]|uniref:hypothetical protein n=1 Tax=Paenacidovorax caeni TaxID=343013 RepID=UPI001113517C|nr:hypothetical protein [Paenacidovorax caeni]
MNHLLAINAPTETVWSESRLRLRAALGWLLTLNPQTLNDCFDQELTKKNIHGLFSVAQELIQPAWSLVDIGI